MSPHSSVSVDRWQEFVTSQFFEEFLAERIFGKIGYLTQEDNLIHASVRNGEVNKATYHQGIWDGGNKIIELMRKYHKEIDNGR